MFAVFLVAAPAFAAPLPMQEKHRLAAYVSYIVSSYEDSAPDCTATYKVGDTCPECRGAGEVGDGVVMMKCIWKSDDGNYFCNNGKVAKAGSSSTAELWEKLGDVKSDDDWGEGTVRGIEEAMIDAIIEGKGQDADDKRQPPKEPEPEPAPPPGPDITQLPQTRWNWQGKGSVPLAEMRRHLADEHSIVPSSLDKMSRSELEALHNLLHNEEVRRSAPADSCPSGNCPSSKSSKSSSGGCPGGNCPTSRPRSRGWLFRRR